MKYSKYANEWLVEFHKEWSQKDFITPSPDQFAELLKISQNANEWVLDPDQEWSRKVPFDIEIAGMLVDSRNDGLMRPVWDAINKRSVNKRLAGERFYGDCIHAFNWSSGERQTRKEKKEQLLAISKKSRELAGLINQYQGISVYAVSSVLDEHCNPEWDRKGSMSFCIPSMKMMLFSLAELADAESKFQPETAKPNATTAHKVVFVRRLTASMRERFGAPLRLVVAYTACVIFETDSIDVKFVRDNTRATK